MRLRSVVIASITIFVAFLAACGGGGGGGVAAAPPPAPPPAAPPPPPPPPPPPVMSAAGLWIGQAVTPAVSILSTSFEFNDTDGFVVGNDPFSAQFSGGVTESRSRPSLYTSGSFSWHVDMAGGTVTFPVAGNALTFSTRTVSNGNVATIQILDENDVEISSTAVPDTFVQITVNRDPDLGESLIGSIVITVDSGEIVMDSFSFDFVDTDSTDDVACIFAPNDEFACLVSDTMSGDVTSAANGTYSVTDTTVSGTGNLYASNGETLADGSLISPLTFSAGTIVEDTSLDLTVDSAGLSIDVSSMFDASYDRGADLATIAGTYTTNDVNGESSSFVIDAMGAINGQTTSGCVFSGQASVIDAAANAYDVNVEATAATCGPLAGIYDGIGVSQDENGTDDAFVFSVFVDGQLFISGEAVM